MCWKLMCEACAPNFGAFSPAQRSFLGGIGSEFRFEAQSFMILRIPGCDLGAPCAVNPVGWLGLNIARLSLISPIPFLYKEKALLGLEL